MEVMLDGQLITCTPEEYMKLKSLGAFGGTTAGQSTQQDLEKRVSDLERLIPQTDKGYDDWLKRGQTQIVAVYGCDMPGPMYGDGFNPPSFNAESFQPSITIAQKGGTSPDVSDTLALTTMAGNTAGLSAQAMGTLTAIVSSDKAAPAPETDPTTAYVLSANDEKDRLIFISSLEPSQYSYKVSRAMTFPTPEEAKKKIAGMTSMYKWIPMPLPSKDACDAIDNRSEFDDSKPVDEVSADSEEPTPPAENEVASTTKESDGQTGYVMSAVNEAGIPIFMFNIMPTQYCYSINEAILFKSEEEAKEKTAGITSKYQWVPIKHVRRPESETPEENSDGKDDAVPTEQTSGTTYVLKSQDEDGYDIFLSTILDSPLPSQVCHKISNAIEFKSEAEAHEKTSQMTSPYVFTLITKPSKEECDEIDRKGEKYEHDNW